MCYFYAKPIPIKWNYEEGYVGSGQNDGDKFLEVGKFKRINSMRFKDNSEMAILCTQFQTTLEHIKSGPDGSARMRAIYQQYGLMRYVQEYPEIWNNKKNVYVPDDFDEKTTIFHNTQKENIWNKVEEVDKLPEFKEATLFNGNEATEQFGSYDEKKEYLAGKYVEWKWKDLGDER